MLKVSVIVPVYNTSSTIVRCLESLVNQTLPEIEIIVVNDGSPDDSQTIIDRYKKIYPSKIKSFIKENGGLSTARNFGIERASGEYIGFVDSDDYVDIDFYERMYNKAKETDADVVTSPITYVWHRSMYKKYYNKKRFGINAREDGYTLLRANSFAWNKIYRKSFWQDNGFEFKQQWFEDSHLIYNVMLSSNIIACVNIPFYHYDLSREGSITSSVDDRIFDIFKSTDSIIDYYKKHNAFDELYDYVSHICIRHLYGRINTLHNAKNRSYSKRYITELLPYLDKNFPDWKTNEFLQCSDDDSNERKYTQLVKRTPFLLKKYAYGNSLLFNLGLENARRKDRKIKKTQLNSTTKHQTAEDIQENQNKLKRKKIQRYGLWMIHDIQVLLGQMGIMSFADFGTCLGIVREHRLLQHDLDIDIGVVADITQQKAVRVAMERLGYRLWRQYIRGEYVVEESYKYNDIKVDLNYYEMTDDYAKTWLFYRKPDVVYTNCERNIVEMTYSPIKEVRQEIVDNVPVFIPSNAEQLLEEKYGSNWRTPDKGWIYWESPAATPLDDIGYYMTIRYMTIKMRSRETPKPILFFDSEQNTLNWDLVHQYADKGFDPVIIGTSQEEKKAKKKHPRIRYYVTDSINPEYIEKVRKRVSGNDELTACSPEGNLYSILPAKTSIFTSGEEN